MLQRFGVALRVLPKQTTSRAALLSYKSSTHGWPIFLSSRLPLSPPPGNAESSRRFQYSELFFKYLAASLAASSATPIPAQPIHSTRDAGFAVALRQSLSPRPVSIGLRVLPLPQLPGMLLCSRMRLSGRRVPRGHVLAWAELHRQLL